MKQHNSQQGSAHVVVIVCLVIALLSALGWIFWQNFILKEEPKKETELVVVDKNQPSVLQITDWSVELPLEPGAPAYSLSEVRQESDDMLTAGKIIVKSSDLRCNVGEVGEIWRLEADKKLTTDTIGTKYLNPFEESDVGKTYKQIADADQSLEYVTYAQAGPYVYRLIFASSSCSIQEKGDAPQTADEKANEEIIDTFVASFENIRLIED